MPHPDAGIQQRAVAGKRRAYHRPFAGYRAGSVLHDREKIGALGEGSMFANIAEVSRAYETREVELQAKVVVRLNEMQRMKPDNW